jgi:cation transport regulator ChaC
VLYFAYGSNMSTPRFSDRVSGMSKIGNGTLSGHALEYHKVSKDGSAKCDIAITEVDDSIVIGIVFKLPDNQLVKLNDVEGYGKGYDSKYVAISLENGSELEALTYFATNIDKELKPYHWYKHHVVFGAQEHGLPYWYIERLKTVESVDDPDLAREAKQMSIYR